MVLILSFRFYVADLPRIVKTEKDKVKSAYREIALTLKQSEMSQVNSIPDNVSLTPVGKMSPGKWGFEFVDGDAAVIVWYKDAHKSCSTRVPPIQEIDIGRIISCGLFVIIAALIILTYFCIKYFYGYVTTRDDFLAATAHDLTTPLVGARFAIGRNDNDARILVERMLRLVDNLKTFLSLGGRRPDLNISYFDLVKAFNEAYSLFELDFKDSESGAVENLGDKSLYVKADETKTIQILWNLLGNDLKYASHYGKISARFSHDDKFAYFELIDCGPGMTKYEMKKAFDRYYRASTVLKSGKGGFGIGLCNAKQSARQMQGDITVYQNKPKGCVFKLMLPKAECILK
jgi:hypothetical protein